MLEELEDIDIHEPVDIYVEPPDENNNTDCDSDCSDYGEAGNLNHLGPNMLRTHCEFQFHRNENENNNIRKDDDFDTSDEEPLCKYRKNKSTEVRKVFRPKKEKLTSVKWNKIQPVFDVISICPTKSISDEAKKAETHLEYFQLFFSNELLSKIVNESNLYASQKNLDLKIKFDEINVVIGALLLSGYAKYPNKRLYWSSNEDVPNILQNSIRLNRFEQILRNVHLNDNDRIDNDRLYKLRPLITELNNKFKIHGGLEEKLSIDESMIPYYGRHYSKQYIKGKPIRFGFKNWALCTSSGYNIAFDIYTGRDENQKLFGLGGDTVLSLIDAADIPPKQGYKLFFDNYFSSVGLFQYLTDHGYCATGTIREGRIAKCPLKSNADMQKLERGTYDYRTDNGNKVCLVRWKDNRVVTCATNFDSIKETNCTRWSKEKKQKITVKQPELFSNYNNGMGGVDQMDQNVATYRTRMRQRKWWWPIFCYLLDVSVSNAWILMRKVHANKKECDNLLNFRRNITLSLLTTFGKPSLKGKSIQNVITDIRYDGLNHWPDSVSTDRLCKFCGGKSRFICSKCGVGLHPKLCFKNYHTF